MLSFAKSAALPSMGRQLPLLAASMALGLLTGCGGGGGGGGGTPPPPPPPSNQAPLFTSTNSIAIVENKGGPIYQAAATDPEGMAVTFSISGGSDAARFSINNGQLAFFTPPNFDLPTDSDLNNVYQVEIRASDGVNQTTQTVSVTVTNSKEGIAVRRVGTGFADPTAMAWIGDTFFLVAERDGAIYSFDARNNGRALLTRLPSVSGQGVLAVAVARDFATTGRFFVMYTTGGFLVVQEYVHNPGGATVPGPSGPLLRVSAPDYAGGGWLGCDPQGNLLVATGDAGGLGDPSGSAQDDSSFLGKIIRAARNPGPQYTLTRLAKGLHQPAGGAVYSSVFSAGLLIGDRGQTVADEVNHLPTGASGVNFGWPFKEGFRTVREPIPAGVTDPVTEYMRTSGVAVQGTVGGAVAGSIIESISGDYVFADRSGAIFTIPTTRTTLSNARTATERRTADFVPDVGAIERPLAVIADSVGILHILDADGEIFRVEPAP